MRLTDEELQDVLARADEIERTSRRGEQFHAELEAVIGAAEEVGLSRQAVERALRERLDLPMTVPTPGTTVWAKSADGKSYVAEVLATSQDDVRVRFLTGSLHDATLDEIRPCSFIPGERVVCDWPWWGPWTCSVVSYDHEKKRVKLSDGWGYIKTFSLSEVWLPQRKPETGGSRRRVYLTLLGAGTAIGALVGSIITALVLG
ncbi:MAG: hypothetical protein ACREOG_00055 [Gemmatimonadaceae bacterium]